MTREPTTTMSVSRQERSAACSVAWLCAFVLGACTPDEQEEPFSPKYVAGSVKMTTSYDNPLCTGNILLAERHSTWLTEVFGTVGDMDFWVYLFAEGEPLLPCGEAESGGISGCWIAPVVFSSWDALSHELVHAAMASL
ncbi:MAG: hypothetical protein KC420_11635, partial [Myxococcales bacterium]|nr:hypothetical protein [Myxococcales bacterium]